MNVDRCLVVMVAALGLFASRPNASRAEPALPKRCNNASIEWTRRLSSRGAIALGGMAATADGGLVLAGGHWGDVRVEAPGAPTASRQSALATTSGFLNRAALWATSARRSG